MHRNLQRRYVDDGSLPGSLSGGVLDIWDGSFCGWLVFVGADLRVGYCNPIMVDILKAGGEGRLREACASRFVATREAGYFADQVLLRAAYPEGWRGMLTLVDFEGGEHLVHCALRLLRGQAQGESDVHVMEVQSEEGRPTGRVEHEDGEEPVSDKALLDALLEWVPASIYFKDSRSRFLRTTRYQARKFGEMMPERVHHRTDFDYFSIEHARQAFRDEQRILHTGQPLENVEERETYAKSGVRWVSTSKFPLRNQNGEIVGTFGISRDITEQKLAEEARREMELKRSLSQKLESIGRLASGVAHELNTPAQFIMDNMQFLKKAMTGLSVFLAAYQELEYAVREGRGERERLEAAEKLVRVAGGQRLGYLVEEIPQVIAETMEGLHRVTHIIRSLREFSHTPMKPGGLADLNKAIATTVVVSRHEWKYVAELKTELDPRLPLLPVHIDEINQVMLNLIVNAAHAIEEAKRARPELAGLITVTTRLEDGCVLLQVGDNGTGIPEAVRPRIFEPFFTTKEVGKGSGQGLSLVHSVVVKHHGGSIDYSTREGAGTVFNIRIPLASGEAGGGRDGDLAGKETLT